MPQTNQQTTQSLVTPSEAQGVQAAANNAPPQGQGFNQRRNSLRNIAFNNRQLREVVDDCLRAMKDGNKPPTIFQQGNMLKRIRKSYPGVFLEPLSIDALRAFMERTANFGEVEPSKKDSWELRFNPYPIPIDYVRDVLALPEWPTDVFPFLKSLVSCPVFTGDGRLLDKPGYDPDSQIWYEPDPRMDLKPVPQNPTDEDIKEAKKWLLDEYLIDFPFQNNHDKTNAVAFLLTPFVRQMISSPTPLGLIEAPVAGTGKGLLAKAIG